MAGKEKNPALQTSRHDLEADCHVIPLLSLLAWVLDHVQRAALLAALRYLVVLRRSGSSSSVLALGLVLQPLVERAWSLNSKRTAPDRGHVMAERATNARRARRVVKLRGATSAPHGGGQLPPRRQAHCITYRAPHRRRAGRVLENRPTATAHQVGDPHQGYGGGGYGGAQNATHGLRRGRVIQQGAAPSAADRALAAAAALVAHLHLRLLCVLFGSDRETQLALSSNENWSPFLAEVAEHHIIRSSSERNRGRLSCRRDVPRAALKG